MNKTNFAHLAIGLAMQLAFFLLFFNAVGVSTSLWFGAIAATSWFISREHAQREYKIGDPSKLKGYEALAFWDWSFDAKLDAALPAFGTILVASIARIL